MYNRSWWLVGLFTFVGCGTGEIPRYDISGEVNFKGKPVKRGAITFEGSDKSVIQGFAKINEGKFDTAQDGVGHIGGPQTIRITGEAGQPPDPNSFQADSYVAKPLFPTFETSAELPKESSTKNFEVK